MRARTIQTLEGERTIQAPPGLVRYAPPAAISARDILEIIRRPDTVLMTFRSGHVWIFTPEYKVEGDTLEQAIQALLDCQRKENTNAR